MIGELNILTATFMILSELGVKVTQQDVQRALVELNIIDQLLRELQAQLIAIDSSIADHERAVELIDEMVKSPEAMNVLVPIGGISMVEATISVKDRLKIGIGQDVFIEAPIQRCREILERRLQGLRSTRDRLVENIQNSSQRAEALRRFLAAVERALEAQRAPKSEG